MTSQKYPNPKPIKERTFLFAVEIVKYSIMLKEDRFFELANQLMKSGTSIGANVREANNGFSTRDFIFKMSIAQKEADETCYWLEIMNVVQPGNVKTLELLAESTEILKIVRTISLNTKINHRIKLILTVISFFLFFI